MNDPWWLAGGVSPENCVAAYQPIGADSLQASYLNLANPGTYNAAPGVAPGFIAEWGWIFNGTSGYLTTGVTLASGYSLICRFITTGTGETQFGRQWDTSTNDNFLTANANLGGLWTVGGKNIVYNFERGVACIADRKCYADGSLIGTVASGGTTQGVVSIGNRPSDDRTMAGSIQAFAIYTVTISADQVAAITNAINPLTGASMPTHHMPSLGMRRWAKLYSQTAFIPAWARNSNRIITPGIQLP